MSLALVWFRQDLRLRDNSALAEAAGSGAAIVPVYLWSPEDEGDWAPGSAAKWWLHHSLAKLDTALRARGSRLIFRQGPAAQVLPRLATEHGAQSVYWNRRYEPAARATEQRVETALRGSGIVPRSFNSALLVEPWEILNGSHKPYRVFTPFKRRVLRDVQVPPLEPIPKLRAPRRWPKQLPLQTFNLLPRIRWDAGFELTWTPGEDGAHRALRRFLKQTLKDYARSRDLPAVHGTSRLSPHLHHGEIGPRQIWHALHKRSGTGTFVSELIWREFAYHLLHHFPDTPERPLRPEFEGFPWQRAAHHLRAWQRGETGIPLVDAGMRELWRTGWMHNRVRMIVASFLVKNLRISWRSGERWFWDTLVDADLANNTLNWQWVAGCGADASPWFRIFNPERQALRFDPQRTYIKRWAADSECRAPIVDLSASREAALESYARMRAGR